MHDTRKKKGSLTSRIFCHKKLVVISDEDITTLPFSPAVQAAILSIFVTVMIWVSYSSGKYFAYQELITLKDKEILHTNLTNENLQYQVTDLHRNFVRLDTYFSQIQKIQSDAVIETGNSNATDKEKEATLGKAAAEVGRLEQEMRGILVSLHGQINDRISTLETLISRTGIDVTKLARNNTSLKKAAAKSAANNSLLADQNAARGQGGPFIPEGGHAFETGSKVFEQSMESNADYLMELEKLLRTLPLSKPMINARVSSSYGFRSDPINGRRAMHHGMDFVGAYRAEIYAPAPGKVVRAGRNGAYGLFVELDHGNGVTTRYGHLAKILVKRSQLLKRGDALGLQGNTGRSTGAHLHYEIRYHNKPLNPYKFIKAGAYVL
ncbi:MAG: peptidoglycan DD-metalloendopeptidase family protein [Rickettsiales bacterium]|nr:peptidoglycan DD-metalloendopeptidase family protein [Rickettsiales bacterium]